jgi:hypothetical protein
MGKAQTKSAFSRSCEHFAIPPGHTGPSWFPLDTLAEPVASEGKRVFLRRHFILKD